MKLEIIYEDKDIIVCFKPVGIATQTAGFSAPDMVSMLKNYLAKKESEKNPYVGIIHRLDQPVSGLLVFAKNKKAAAALSRQIQDGNANKDYLAMCYKVPEERKGTLVHYMMKDSVTKLAKVAKEAEYVSLIEKESGKNVPTQKDNVRKEKKKKEIEEEKLKSSYKKAILYYEVEKELEDSSILKVRLQTGRFHQIRAQFAAIGNALLGDTKYASAESRELSVKKKINKIALCAYRLSFKHPVTGKEMEFVLKEDNLPDWYKIK